MIEPNEVLEGSIRKIEMFREWVGVGKYQRELFRVVFLVGDRSVQCTLQVGSPFFLCEGDVVRASGVDIAGMLHVYALKNLTDGSMYAWTVSGRFNHRYMKRSEAWAAGALATIGCVALVSAGLFGSWETFKGMLIGVLVCSAALAVAWWISRTLFEPALHDDFQPGEVTTEQLALKLLGIEGTEVERVIWL